MPLTFEQLEIVHFAESGHNLLITGQAGTGKSFLVQSLIQRLKSDGKIVAVLCSSGVACTVYKQGFASTVHSFFGFQTAELPCKQVIERSLANNLVRENIKKTDCFIWDEISMSSQRMLELVNNLLSEGIPEGDSNMAFGGKQVILVGDFLQLRPVPNFFDEGEFMYLSPVFTAAFPHRCNLTQIMRQNDDEREFLSALGDLRLGHYSDENVEYLCSLSRELDEETAKSAIHIFFRKIPAQMHNMSVLRDLPGNAMKFDAICEGHTNKLTCTVQKVLILKPGCRVMLLWNVSKMLKNGSLGTFVGQEGDKLKVTFDGEGTILLKRETWIKRDRTGHVIGQICQFPLGLAYAITCHKSQGLTLKSAVVHCSREFVSGLTYVACSRVKSEKKIQLLDFKGNLLLAPTPEMLHQCRTDFGDVSNLDKSCCCKKELEKDCFEVKERFSGNNNTNTDEDPLFPDHTLDVLVRNYFESNDVPIAEDVVSIYDRIARDEHQCSRPPPTFDVSVMLHSLIIDEPVHQNEIEKNYQVQYLCALEQKNAVNAFANLVWYHLFLNFRQHLINHDNMDDILFITRPFFTSATGELHAFMGSQEYVRYVKGLFSTNVTSVAQTIVAFEVTMSLYHTFLQTLCELFTRQYAEECVQLIDVSEMPVIGQSKVRHVGGWVVRKLLETSRKYIRENIYSLNMKTVENITMHSALCTLLEEHCIVPFSELEATTVYSGTLDVTEGRQYRQRGLIHISDKLFEFFMKLEQKRVELINESRLMQSRQNLLADAQDQITKNVELQRQWDLCFEVVEKNKEDHIGHLYKKGVKHYVNMGGNQFLRDYRRAHSLKKSAQLRKKVLQKQEKAKEKRESIPYQDILQDHSTGKVESHARLANFIRKFECEALARSYNKHQLFTLCRAYQGHCKASHKKILLAREIAKAVRQNNSIPSWYLVDNREYAVVQTDITNRHLRIRIRCN